MQLIACSKRGKKKKRCIYKITFVNLTLKKKLKTQNFWQRWFGCYWFNPLRRTQFAPRGKHTPDSVIESNKLMLHSEILTVSSESRAKRVNIWIGTCRVFGCSACWYIRYILRLWMVITVIHWPVVCLGEARSLRRIVVLASVCCAQISRTGM